MGQGCIGHDKIYYRTLCNALVTLQNKHPEISERVCKDLCKALDNLISGHTLALKSRKRKVQRFTLDFKRKILSLHRLGYSKNTIINFFAINSADFEAWLNNPRCCTEPKRVSKLLPSDISIQEFLSKHPNPHDPYEVPDPDPIPVDISKEQELLNIVRKKLNRS